MKYCMKRIFSREDLIKLIVPLVMELLFTLLVGMIDSIMVASAGESAVSGVSLIDTVFQLLIYIFAAFGTGGAVVAGQYLGAGREDTARKTTEQLVWFSGISSIVIMTVVYGIKDILLGHVFGSITAEVYWNANRYVLISAISIPAISIYESGAAIFRTMGNSKITMYISMLMNLINISGNAIFIYCAGLGTAGAALSTVIARYVAAGEIILLLLRKNQKLYLMPGFCFVPDFHLIKKILKIGIPNGIENGLFQAGKIILASLAASFGTVSITANAVCQTIASIQVIPGSAVSMAVVPVIARCVGAGDEEQTKYYNRRLILTAYVVLILFCSIFWMMMPAILSGYHLSAATGDLTKQMVFIHTLGAMVIWPLTFVLPSGMRAAGDVRFAMIISIISMFLFRILTAFFFAKSLGIGVAGIWIATLCDWLFRAIMFCIRWFSGKWKNKSMIN